MLWKRLDVNEVKVRGGKGVLNGTPFLFAGDAEVSKFQGFNVSKSKARMRRT
ncbi:hypothetical protein SBA1_480018 [Candidatus Sulfotelmatobacter kueseliae]|uniref:Uncharacterized protein n=1 Tax=Candidatus Sulfotelmatobacter kueseliae TaxID=2042962 RepID=A0A2U3KU15_9BACT|nr:hypothetical protein SBA1_480018 [Candidatus Sulfotelmatobacter kueseliae]